jgi:peptide/nickel transport system substrate-binding protein
VYEKHAAYRPRPDGTLSFTAGPRVAHLDRVVLNVMPDPAAAAVALQAGSVDWIEQPLIDLLPVLRRSRDVAVEVQDPSGMLGHLRFNHLHPPFNNPAVRRLVLAAVGQADCMTAVAGENRSLWRDGLGVFAPGSPMATDAGMEARAAPRDLPALKRALTGPGYRGERVVMLAAAEVRASPPGPR